MTKNLTAEQQLSRESVADQLTRRLADRQSAEFITTQISYASGSDVYRIDLFARHSGERLSAADVPAQNSIAALTETVTELAHRAAVAFIQSHAVENDAPLSTLQKNAITQAKKKQVHYEITGYGDPCFLSVVRVGELGGDRVVINYDPIGRAYQSARRTYRSANSHRVSLGSVPALITAIARVQKEESPDGR